MPRSWLVWDGVSGPEVHEIPLETPERGTTIDIDGLARDCFGRGQPSHGISNLFRLWKAFERHHLLERNHLRRAIVLGRQRQTGRYGIDANLWRQHTRQRCRRSGQRLF